MKHIEKYGSFKYMKPKSEDEIIQNILKSKDCFYYVCDMVKRDNDFGRLKKIVEHGLDLKSEENKYLIICAVLGKNIEIIKYLLSFNVDVNVQNKEGFTPLIYTVQNKNREIVELLLKHGADPNLCTKSMGYTPLHYSVNIINKIGYDITELLLKFGANPLKKDVSLKTPIDIFLYEEYNPKIPLTKYLKSYHTERQKKLLELFDIYMNYH